MGAKHLLIGVLAVIVTVSIIVTIMAAAPYIAGIAVIGGICWYAVKFHGHTDFPTK